ncbi:MAG: hypothetical protein ACRC7P_08710 [Enterovibrio sp.]
MGWMLYDTNKPLTLRIQQAKAGRLTYRAIAEESGFTVAQIRDLARGYYKIKIFGLNEREQIYNAINELFKKRLEQ